MKKIFVVVSICAIVAASIIYYAEATGGEEKSEVSLKVRALADKYGEKFFASVFSLDEFRTFSIVKLNSLLEKYENKWVSPVVLAEMITPEEKDTIVMNAIEMIEKVYKSQKNEMFEKIKRWCMADIQFEFLKTRMEFDNNKILKAISEANAEMRLNESNIMFSSDISGIEQQLDKEKTYFATLNMIASWTFENQMKYYSKIYYQLALIK